jgi:hypothetical protein
LHSVKKGDRLKKIKRAATFGSYDIFNSFVNGMAFALNEDKDSIQPLRR